VVLDLLLADGRGEIGRGLKRGTEFLLHVLLTISLPKQAWSGG
jgi:hypothetical protein